LAVGSALNAAPAPNESFPISPLSAVPAAGLQETSLRSYGAFDSQAPAGYTRDRIDQPIHDESFPRVLGLKVERWVQDGVQRVWLDVHPADMGPVAISIALNGQQAELNFGAESATARQAIEFSLPELAAALQNAGLTLSGGSISQQLSQSKGQEEQTTSSPLSGSQPGSGRANAIAAADPMPGRRTVGLLDLYA
jgi:flagellar hook-length control protein FliK